MKAVSTCLPILVGLISDDGVVTVVVIVIMVIADEGDNIIKPTYVPGATI